MFRLTTFEATVLAVVVTFILSQPNRANDPAQVAISSYFPPPESKGGWRKLDKKEEILRQAGMDPDKLAELRDWLLKSDQRDFAAVVIRKGAIVLEVERGNSSRTDSRRVASVSKAICATVLAIASEESRLGRTSKKMAFDDPAFDFIPWAEPLSDPRKAKITVKQLLAETSMPAEEYQALLKEHEESSRGFRKAETDVERKTAVESMAKFPRRFIELADKYPNDPIALESLTQAVRVLNSADSLTQTAWETNKAAFPDKSTDNSAEKAIALLLRDHIRNDKLGLVCERMRYGIRKEYETFLHKVLKASPHKDVQGLACLSLAEFLKSHLQKLDLIEERPVFAERYKGLLGKEYFEELQRKGHVNLAMEVESLLEQAATIYADVKMPYGGSVGEQAKAELFEIRHLTVGKETSDIEGKDQDGKQFKLSDYRGKVVLLYFWSEY